MTFDFDNEVKFFISEINDYENIGIKKYMNTEKAGKLQLFTYEELKNCIKEICNNLKCKAEPSAVSIVVEGDFIIDFIKRGETVASVGFVLDTDQNFFEKLSDSLC